MTMTQAPESKPFTAERNGVTIKVGVFTHDDWSQGFEVRLDRAGEHSCFVPFLKTEAEARKVANAVWHACSNTDRSLVEIRDAADTHRVVRQRRAEIAR